MKKYIVTTVDIGLDSNFVPHCIGIFDNQEEAKKALFKDMDSLVESAEGMEYDLDKTRFVFRTIDESYGAVWNIEEIEI